MCIRNRQSRGWGAGAVLVALLVGSAAAIDRVVPQISIDAKFVEISQSGLEELGFEWQLLGSDLLSDTPLTPSIKTSGAMQLPLPVASYLDDAQFSAVLRALEQSGKSRILSAPRLTALNGRTATIDVLNTVLVPAADPPVEIVPDLSVKLSISPVVTSSGSIVLTVRPEVSALNDSAQLPDLKEDRARTAVSVNAGQTVAIGGLFREATDIAEDRVPILGRIPMLGSLFRGRGGEGDKREIILFVTARPVDLVGGGGGGGAAPKTTVTDVTAGDKFALSPTVNYLPASRNTLIAGASLYYGQGDLEFDKGKEDISGTVTDANDPDATLNRLDWTVGARYGVYDWDVKGVQVTPYVGLKIGYQLADLEVYDWDLDVDPGLTCGLDIGASAHCPSYRVTGFSDVGYALRPATDVSGSEGGTRISGDFEYRSLHWRAGVGTSLGRWINLRPRWLSDTALYTGVKWTLNDATVKTRTSWTTFDPFLGDITETARHKLEFRSSMPGFFIGAGVPIGERNVINGKLIAAPGYQAGYVEFGRRFGPFWNHRGP